MDYMKQLVSDIVREYETTDPYQLARYLGIEVDTFPFRRIKGFIVNDLRDVLIVLNQKMPEHEQKAVLCHELGHYFLSPPNASYLYITTTYMHSKYEYEPNRFMIEFLTYEKYPEIDETLDMYARRIGVPVELMQYKK